MPRTFKTIISNAFSIILTSLILSACGGGGGTTNQPPITVTITCPNGVIKTAATLDLANTSCSAPTMLSISPASGSTAVLVDAFTSIDGVADSTLDATSITTATITLNAGLNAVAGTVSVVGIKAFKFTPIGRLNYGQQYTFTATVKDTLGRALSIESTFTTATAPRILINTNRTFSGSAPLIVETYSDGYVKNITFNADTENIVGTALGGHTDATTLKAIKTDSVVESDGITNNLTYTFADGYQNFLIATDISKLPAYVIPSDIGKIVYPNSYLTPTDSSTLQLADTCNIDKATITYPKTYIGKYPLPVVTGAPLKSTILRGATIKDSWGTNNASIINGCSGNTEYDQLTKTFNRLKLINVDYISLNPWTSIEINNGVWKILNPGDPGGGGFDDSTFETITKQAHNSGLQVHWTNQIQVVHDASVYGGYFVPTLTQDNLDKFFAAYEPFMMERAAFLEKIGVNAMMISCTCWALYENDPLYINTYITAITSLIPKLKNIYSGKIMMNSFDGINTNGVISNGVDYIYLEKWLNFGSGPTPAPSVSAIKQMYIDSSTSKLPMLDPTKKYIVQIGSQSRSDFYSGDSEEGSCTLGPYSGYSGGILPAGQCYQRTLATDFSAQAMVYEASLEFVNDQNTFNIVGVEAIDYIHTNPILPTNAFPNIAYSPRNKPAEGILKMWFAK